ncbi:MAG: hypothetical protein KDD67_17245 [Ignavibacteriae bacterium]|nr:hypothetical protein [Ignavibacteriota bacterium]MCB9217413.1 hypothetical protein [Ignavibacteria bacterium]
MFRRAYIVSLLLVALSSFRCGEGEEAEVVEKVDPRIEQVFSATRIVLDSGSSHENVYTGEELQTFLNGFQPDSFHYDPTHVRLVSDCRGGTVTIGSESYLLSLCRLNQGDNRRVLSVGMGTDVLRFVEKER